MPPDSPRPRVLVTGASRRIGQAVAVHLAARGCDLGLTSSRGEAALDATVEAVRGRVGEAVAVQRAALDLADAASVDRLGAMLAEGTLDGIVHNASVYESCPLAETGESRLVRDFAIHAAGPLRLTAALRPALRRSRHPAGPAVLFALDIHAPGKPRAGWASYLLSKAASAALVEILAIELAPAVRVAGVAFGAVLWPEAADPAEIAAYEARTPLARSGTAEEAADAVAYLLLDAAFASGAVLRLDGGRSLR
jgi:pteridine reductase